MEWRLFFFYLCTDQDTVMRNSSFKCNMSIRLSLLGGLMVHRELELPFSCAMHRSAGVYPSSHSKAS